MNTYTLILYYKDRIVKESIKRMDLKEAWDFFKNHLWGEIVKVEIEIE